LTERQTDGQTNKQTKVKTLPGTSFSSGCSNEIIIEIELQCTTQHCQGKSEFIGRALAKPVVKASSEKYSKPSFPPHLEWFDICRGSDRAGELLAAFELLQV